MEENKEIIKDNLEEEFRKEILKNSDKKLSDAEIKKLTEEAMVSLNFMQEIDKVELPSDKYVVFTDGEEQLYYENGEFYVISTTDSTKIKKKKSKKEATDMYLDFFIKYQLNPILDQRDIKRQKLEIMQKENDEKAKLAQQVLKKEATQEQQKAQREQQKQVDKDEISL
ncbi:MAG: hypothetical protein J6A15_05655 [Clostridia bacterium]|nr:hypothetical protein [Clostridia bacterium]